MKITMYELLGLVKDDKAPKKIKYEDRTYTLYLDEENNHYYQDDKCKYFMLSISCFEELNDEVEILKEKKKIPEKLKIEQDTSSNYYIRNENGAKCYLTTHSKMIIETLNQVIDYIKSKGE